MEELKPPKSIYLIYAQKDEAFKQEFEAYLAILQQNGLISGWVERQVQPGTDWSHVIDSHLLVTDLVFFLLSPALLASGYCSGAEMHEIFRRREAGEIRVIPVLLSYANIVGNPLEMIQPLPMNSKPVLSWTNQNDAWKEIDQEIRRMLKYY